MNMSEMIVKLQEYGCNVQKVPGDNRTLHVDGHYHPEAKGLPDWLWQCGGWSISGCGCGRAFVSMVG